MSSRLLLVFERISGVCTNSSDPGDALSRGKVCSPAEKWRKYYFFFVFLAGFRARRGCGCNARGWIYGFASTSHCAAADLSRLP